MSKVNQNAKEDKNTVFCAIDLHQNSLLAGIAYARGAEIYEAFNTDEEDGIVDLVQTLYEQQRAHPGSEVFVAYEASGCGFRLADILEEEGFKVSVLAPTHLPSSQKSRSNKTDKRDVKRIMDVLRGHVLAGGELPKVWIPSPKIRDDREIVRRRLDIQDQLAAVKNRIHGLLRRYGKKKPESIRTNWSKNHLRWIRGQVAHLEPGAGRHLLSLLRELDFYIEEMSHLEQELLELADSPEYQPQVLALTKIKGVGILTAMVFLTELGDLVRFPNRRCVGSYLGLVPKSYESGEQDDRKGHISRMGPSRVRKVLNQAAWSHVMWDPEAKEWFEQHSQGKKILKRKAITAMMRRLSVRMWHEALMAA